MSSNTQTTGLSFDTTGLYSFDNQWVISDSIWVLRSNDQFRTAKVKLYNDKPFWHFFVDNYFLRFDEAAKKGWKLYDRGGLIPNTTKEPNKITGLRPTVERGTNPKDALGLVKTPLSLIPQTALVAEAAVFADGARKYGEYNWRVAKVRARVYIEAAMRHLAALLDGEDYAADSGCHHAAHVRSCMAIIIDATVCGTLIDDRPVAGKAAEMMAEYDAKQKEKRGC